LLNKNKKIGVNIFNFCIERVIVFVLFVSENFYFYFVLVFLNVDNFYFRTPKTKMNNSSFRCRYSNKNSSATILTINKVVHRVHKVETPRLYGEMSRQL